MLRHYALASVVLLTCGCSSSSGNGGDKAFEQQVVTDMHDTLLSDVSELHQAAADLASAAPTPSGRGWDADLDKDAIAAMTAAWIRARSAYERTEGALAPLFPDIDFEIDARYDDFLADPTILKAGGDQDLFDDQGVTGMHAIERILFVKTTPERIVTVESQIPGYKAAAWPSTEVEAGEFKTKLAAKLVTDTQTLEGQWQPSRIDLEGAYGGLVALMNEQREKVNKAASDEEESRYSQRTMADIRDNLAGTKKVYSLFEKWVASKANGATINTTVRGGFDGLDTDYGEVTGDAIPEPPATWSSENPSAADLETPFGKLFSSVHEAVDPNRKGSVVDSMNQAASVIGLAEFTQ
jgi:iron uptake system component EfeO